MRHRTLSLFLISFLSGWIGSCMLLQRQFSQRQAHLREQAFQEVHRWKDSVRSLGGQFYGDSLFYRPEGQSDSEARLKAFTPSETTEFISIGYFGGYTESCKCFVLTGNGEFYSELNGERNLITKVPTDRCTAFFRQIITSGILNYSAGVLNLKMEILRPESYSGVTDTPLMRIQIWIPKLNIEKEIEVSAPEIQVKNFPDIIEFRLILELQSEMLKLASEN